MNLRRETTLKAMACQMLSGHQLNTLEKLQKPTVLVETCAESKVEQGGTGKGHEMTQESCPQVSKG